MYRKLLLSLIVYRLRRVLVLVSYCAFSILLYYVYYFLLQWINNRSKMHLVIQIFHFRMNVLMTAMTILYFNCLKVMMNPMVTNHFQNKLMWIMIIYHQTGILLQVITKNILFTKTIARYLKNYWQIMNHMIILNYILLTIYLTVWFWKLIEMLNSI